MTVKYHNRTSGKVINRMKKKMRIRKKVFGTNDRPRMNVFRSNKHIYVQLINDENSETLVNASSLKFGHKSLNKEVCKKIGETVANKAKEKNISCVVFDRNGYLYHGKIKELADAVRDNGLKF